MTAETADDLRQRATAIARELTTLSRLDDDYAAGLRAEGRRCLDRDVMRDLVKAYVNRHRRLIEGDEVLPQRIADLQAERAERAARAASVDTTEED